MFPDRRLVLNRISMLSEAQRKSATVIYDGPIRSGGATSGFESGFKIKREEASGLVFLDPIPADAARIYGSGGILDGQVRLG